VEKKNSLYENIKKWEEEYNYLHKDIQSLNSELAKIRKEKADLLAQSLVNELDMKVSGEMYNIHFMNHLEEKKKRKADKMTNKEGIN